MRKPYFHENPPKQEKASVNFSHAHLCDLSSHLCLVVHFFPHLRQFFFFLFSLFDSLLDESDSFSTLQVYNFLLMHLCPGTQLYPQYLHLFTHFLSELDFSVEYLFGFSFEYLFDASEPANDGLLNLSFCSISIATYTLKTFLSSCVRETDLKMPKWTW